MNNLDAATCGRKRLAILAAVAVSILLSSSTNSSADTFTATASLPGTLVSFGSPVLASVNFGSEFVSIDSICFQFTFQIDLLDPGEDLIVTPLSLYPSLAGPGVSNPFPESQDSRTVCLLNAFGYETFTALFLDGSEDIELGTHGGSVDIADLTVIVTGQKTISQQLTDLLAAVTGVGPGTSLADKVAEAQVSFANGSVPNTCSKLAAFINQVTGHSRGKKPIEGGTNLIASANLIRDMLGCSPEVADARQPDPRGID